MPPEPLGNRTKMESTAALLPKHGSRAMGFGTDCGKQKQQKKGFLLKSAKSWSSNGVLKTQILPSFLQLWNCPACVQSVQHLGFKSRLLLRKVWWTEHSCSHRQSDNSDSLIPISPVYPQLIHTETSFPAVNTVRICCCSPPPIFTALPRRRLRI